MSGKDGTSAPEIADAMGFLTEYAKSGRSTCKVCKELIDQGVVRLGAEVPSPYLEGATIPLWGHPKCVFRKLKRPRKPECKTIMSVDDIKGFEDLKKKDQKSLKSMVDAHAKAMKELPDLEWTELIIEGQFWKIARSGKVTHTSYGNRNARHEAMSMVKEHASVKLAEAYEQKMIADKKKKGYQDADDVKEEEEKGEDVEAKKKPGTPLEAKKEPGTPSEEPDVYGFQCEYAKSSRSRCKGCNDFIDQGELRIAKIVNNPYVKASDPDKPAMMPMWFHQCCFWRRQRKGNVHKTRLTDCDAMEGFSSLKAADRKALKAKVKAETAALDAFSEDDRAEQVYLEAKVDDNTKWWGISRHDAFTRTRWGELGEEGHFVLKEFGDEDAATAYLNNMVTSKLKGAYELISIDGSEIKPEEREERAKFYEPKPKTEAQKKKKTAAKKRKRKVED